ncbi:hypothetical protein CG723_39530 [Streptomyces sp. CB01635]|uniref:hypothetical protein n=1 Tax=unclassified Streptomyces TaxID=2593676 RepID=UPI000C2721E6|nr:hypothetical protein [Streptomyces sp. CB01635]PJN06356.1 hypothetical protein CG723_39530 [Streptomyces sp. CB01635]
MEFPGPRRCHDRRNRALRPGGLRLAATPEGRRRLDGGIRLVATPLAVLVLSYYGEFGPLDHPPLPGPYDLLTLVALSLACYTWALHSGCRTQQLDRTIA